VKLATPRWRTPLIFLGVLLLIGVLAPAVSAAPGAATAAVTHGTVPAGTTDSYEYTLTPTSVQIRSFNLTAPTGWTIKSVDSAPTGVQLAPGSTTVIQGRGLTITSSSPLTVVFTAQAPCAAGRVAWTTEAKTGGNFTGAAVSVNPVPASVTENCTAAFVTQPADAEFGANTNGPSQNITSVPYTANGTDIQAIVKDAKGGLRPDTLVTLAFETNPRGATLAGPISAESDDRGIATFDGNCDGCSPITIDKIGQGYKLKAEGIGVKAIGLEEVLPFGIYQEGEVCTTNPEPCVVQGHSGNNRLTTTVTTPPNGNLGVFVTSEEDVICDGFNSPFTTQAVIVWKYTGDGSQMIVADISKAMMREVLDRGSAHLDFCLDSEGKAFTDKFGDDHWGTSGNDTPGLLSDCNTGIDPDTCIVSQTALSGGGRRVTVRVVDGRGRF
jgi:hypothetical protein